MSINKLVALQRLHIPFLPCVATDVYELLRPLVANKLSVTTFILCPMTTTNCDGLRLQIYYVCICVFMRLCICVCMIT